NLHNPLARAIFAALRRDHAQINSASKQVLVYKEVARDWLNDPLATIRKQRKRCQFLSEPTRGWEHINDKTMNTYSAGYIPIQATRRTGYASLPFSAVRPCRMRMGTTQHHSCC